MKMRITYWMFACLIPVLSEGQGVMGFKQSANGATIAVAGGTLDISVLADNAVRIKFFAHRETTVPELVFTSPIPTTGFTVTDFPSNLELKANRIIVDVDKHTGSLSFADHAGTIFLREKEGTRKLLPDSVMGEPCFVAEQSFVSLEDEYLFGLGQFQDGQVNVRNITRRLTQVNSQISLPFIYSSKGYGLLWHQYGLTDFNPTDSSIALVKEEQSSDGHDRSSEVTTTSGSQRLSQRQSFYTGHFRVPVDGIYSLFLNLGDMGNRQYVAVDGKPCIDVSNFWLPPCTDALVELKAGEHQVRVVCKSGNTPTVSWKLTDNETTFRSPNAKLLDYVVFYGPSADSVIAAYRNLSGNVPMLPRWAYGFWQCRERYTSGADLVNTVKEFRQKKIPMDVIVQDWQYWGKSGWGVPKFDTTNYSNPAGFIKEIHDLHAHFSISIWSNPDKNSAIGNVFVSKNLFVPETKWLDYFNPLTRELYWKTLD
ncbi:MAG TPA: TIM-barrel domain-containing protein, partial [Bacteroidota bacterium]|nr:TIM-barrel domain-containing protein [Bacteroidota bacterium]